MPSCDHFTPPPNEDYTKTWRKVRVLAACSCCAHSGVLAALWRIDMVICSVCGVLLCCWCMI